MVPRKFDLFQNLRHITTLFYGKNESEKFTLELTHAAATAIVAIDALHSEVIQQIKNNNTPPMIYFVENIHISFIYPISFFFITTQDNEQMKLLTQYTIQCRSISYVPVMHDSRF